MTQRAKKNKKTYHSMMELEKEFFPNSHQAQIKEEKEQEKKPGAFGAELATEFLEDVKRKLSK